MREGPTLTRRYGRRTVAAVVAGSLLAGLTAFAIEPTLLRPLIRHVVHDRSGRTIDFGALRLALSARLEPRLEFDDLTIDNAPWAASREPLVRARKVGLELTWSGLVSTPWTVERLVLEDAAVELERDRDGRRNSRLSSADGRGPIRAEVLRIDARRSRLHIVDGVTGFELRIGSTPLAAPRVVGGLTALPLTRTLDFEGRQRGTPFSGRADVSDLVTLQTTGERFALQGEIHTAAARMTVVGAAADLLVGLQVEADLHLDADPLSGLQPGLLPRLPPLRDVVADGHLRRDSQRWAVSSLHVASRGSAIEGGFDLRPAATTAERPRLDARLRATRLDVDEWTAVGRARAARIVAASAASAARAAAPKPLDPPAAAFDRTVLGRIDAAIELDIDELVAEKAVVVRDARLESTLERGRLDVALRASRIAGGHGSAKFGLDTASNAAVASFDAELAGVQLRELPPAWRAALRQVRGGSFSASASIGVRGRTLADWIGSASGSLRASLDGASVSDRLEAKLGLDGFAFLRSLLSGVDAVPVRCAEVAFDLEHGRATLRRLTLDTARTAVTGTGSIDLVGRTLDVVLEPSSHAGSIFALDRDIHLTGPLARPHASLQAAAHRAPPAACNGG